MKKVEFELGIDGYGRLEVDGEQQSGIRATTVHSEAGQLTTVELEHVAAVFGKAEGDVQYSVYIDPIGFGKGATLRDALTDLIRQIDSQEA